MILTQIFFTLAFFVIIGLFLLAHLEKTDNKVSSEYEKLLKENRELKEQVEFKQSEINDAIGRAIAIEEKLLGEINKLKLRIYENNNIF